MTSYAEMARERKRARPLYLELRALGLGLHVKEEAADPTGYDSPLPALAASNTLGAVVAS